MVLGHEVAGEVVEIGEGVTKVRSGQRVAVNPTRPCLHCRYCLSGHSNLCSKRVGIAGTFRFHEEFQWAVQALITGRINVDPILSAQFTFPDAIKAFELASDRRRAVKVSLIA